MMTKRQAGLRLKKIEAEVDQILYDLGIEASNKDEFNYDAKYAAKVLSGLQGLVCNFLRKED